MRRLIVVLAAALLLVCSCGGSGSGGSTTSGDVKVIKVSVKNGKVTPQTHRESVPKGDKVRLQVTSDTSDEIHVHGYDLKKDLTAGKTGTLQFTADQPGLFEVELESASLQLLQLEVR